MSYILVLCTVESQKQGKMIASILVGEQLAACANILPKHVSIYRWEDKIIEDEENLLIIKTKASLFAQLKNRIKELHTYDLPEIVAIDINDANSEYLNWIDKETIKPEMLN